MSPGAIPTRAECEVPRLGACEVESPLAPVFPSDSRPSSFTHIHEDDRVLVVDTVDLLEGQRTAPDQLPSFEPCYPRRRLFFEPARATVAIVTCGGLCPGLNDVVRALVQELRRQYGVERILGIRNGYRGLTRERSGDVVELNGRTVRDIHRAGGTFLGSSRGRRDPREMVDTLLELGVDVLFVVGGDGTMRGAREIVAVLDEREAPVSVIGIPKTIDNDLPFIDQSFGFQTAVAEAARSVRSALAEARSVHHGVAVVKLMGRHGGFIACHAAIALNDVDFVLVPEVPFVFDGEDGLLAHVRERVERRGSAVVVVAEGAEPRVDGATAADATGSGDGADIGTTVSARIERDLVEHGHAPVVRYLDPSYAIRSVPATTYDSVYCVRLAHAAVHAAMAGRTGAVVSQWRQRLVLVPMALMTDRPNRVDPGGELWATVLEATRQPTRLDVGGVGIGPRAR